MKFLIPLFVFSAQGSLKSRSLEEHILHQKNQFQEKFLSHLCKKQIKKNKIPSACYQIAGQDQKFLNFLDEKCLEAEKEVFSLKSLFSILKNSSISEKCRRFLLKKKEILNYQFPLRVFFKNR